jgi:hypothetical protein
MTLWSWIAVGAAAFVLLSAAVGLAVAAVLARIGREISELLESEPELFESELSASAPLARERAALEEDEAETPVRHFAGQLTRPPSR